MGHSVGVTKPYSSLEPAIWILVSGVYSLTASNRLREPSRFTLIVSAGADHE